MSIFCILISNIVCAQYEITSRQVPSFNESEQVENHDVALNELNHKIQDFIAENISSEFVAKFFKYKDSLEFNFEILINKYGLLNASDIKVNTEVDFFNQEIEKILSNLPKFKPAKAVLTDDMLDFFLTYTAEYYIDDKLKFKSIYRETIRQNLFIKSGETPLIQTAEKLGYIIPNQTIKTKLLFHLSKDREVKNIRFYSPHINFEIMMRKIFQNIAIEKSLVLKSLKVDTDYIIPVHIYLDKNLDKISFLDSKSRDNNEDSKQPNNIVKYDKAPIMEGCEKEVNDNLTEVCNNKKIYAFIIKNFDSQSIDRLNLNGKQKISLMFDINEEGIVENIRTRAPNSTLEREAKRVISLLPKFQPATLKNKPVKVTLLLPITFNTNNKRDFSSPLFDSSNPYMRN